MKKIKFTLVLAVLILNAILSFILWTKELHSESNTLVSTKLVISQ